MDREPDSDAAGPQRPHEFVAHPFGIDDRHAAVQAHDRHVRDRGQRVHQLGQPPRRQHQRIAAGQDHFPDFGPRADIGQCRRQLPRRQRLAARPDLLAAEAETAIDRTDMQRLQQHAVGIAMDDAFYGRAGLVADRVGQFGGRDFGLLPARHELPRDRVVREIRAIDQRRHLRGDGDRHRLRGVLQPRIGRQQALAFKVVQGTQRRHDGGK